MINYVNGYIAQAHYLFDVIFNPRRACAARVTVVVVCVCQSVTRHLTSRAINRSTNNSTYSASGIGRKIGGVFSETVAFGSYSVKDGRKSQYAN